MDVEAFAKPEYDYIQMEEIKSAIKDGMDVAQLCNPLFDFSVMREIRMAGDYQKRILKFADEAL